MCGFRRLVIFFFSVLTINTASAQGVSFNSTGAVAHSSAIVDASSTSQGVLVPRMTLSQRDSILSPATGLMIFQTNGTSGFYYYSGSSWNAVGASLPSGTNGQVLQLTSGSPAWSGNTLNIGDSYGGGKVAYILQSGDPGYSPIEQHGLIVSNIDLTTSTNWGSSSYTNAIKTGLNTGNFNTILILVVTGVSVNAAFIASSYTTGIYNDWYLPSKDELNKLYVNRVALGGFSNANYWSSTEFNNTNAYYQNLSNGLNGTITKGASGYVRAVRSF